MKKFFALILLLFISLPVFSGELENAVNKNSKVFLYMYMPSCTYCEKFKPLLDKVVVKYNKKLAVAKVDITTPYGKGVMRTFDTFYVPCVILLDYKKQTMHRVDPKCMLDFACLKDAVDEFTN